MVVSVDRNHVTLPSFPKLLLLLLHGHLPLDLQTGDLCTSIGSGMLQLGLAPRQAIGIYSVNCKGEQARTRNDLGCKGFGLPGKGMWI